MKNFLPYESLVQMYEKKQAILTDHLPKLNKKDKINLKI